MWMCVCVPDCSSTFVYRNNDFYNLYFLSNAAVCEQVLLNFKEKNLVIYGCSAVYYFTCFIKIRFLIHQQYSIINDFYAWISNNRLSIEKQARIKVAHFWSQGFKRALPFSWSFTLRFFKQLHFLNVMYLNLAGRLSPCLHSKVNDLT